MAEAMVPHPKNPMRRGAAAPGSSAVVDVDVQAELRDSNELSVVLLGGIVLNEDVVVGILVVVGMVGILVLVGILVVKARVKENNSGRRKRILDNNENEEKEEKEADDDNKTGILKKLWATEGEE
jgi:hypothetical protein